jgi:diguanylate cyclase (GGDEF)-like protein
MTDSLNDFNFGIPEDLLDEIQHNIEHIITTFNVPEEDKMEIIRQINFMYSKTKYLSFTDALTKLPNRRNFESTLNKEFLRAKRYNNKLTVAMFDIDCFKQINDKYGHQCGDTVLKEISQAALQTFRKTDTIFRIGGEEFVVILTETDINQSIIPLERFRKTVETMIIDYNDIEINLTVSIGACQLTEDIKTPDNFMEEVDKCLYSAKNGGRNNTVLKTYS